MDDPWAWQHQLPQHPLRCARIERLGGELDAFFESGGAPGDEQGGPAVEQHDIAQRTARAGQQVAHQPGVVLGLAAVQLLEPRRRQTDMLGDHLKGLDLAVFE